MTTFNRFKTHNGTTHHYNSKHIMVSISYNYKILIPKQTYAISLAYQQQLNASYYPMMFQQTQQAQMRALQSQVQLPQQIGLTFTSAGPVCSSRSFTPSTSQTIYPVTTVQSHSEQYNSVCDNSASLSSSQVHTYIVKHRRTSV